MEGDFETGNTEELSPDAGIRVMVGSCQYDMVSGGRDEVDHQMEELGGPVRARRSGTRKLAIARWPAIYAGLEATTRPPNCVFST
jgi:hypothetical protein